MCWLDIKTIPDLDGTQVLVGFMGQFAWFSYVVSAYGDKTRFDGYGEPTHWTHIIPPKD